MMWDLYNYLHLSYLIIFNVSLSNVNSIIYLKQKETNYTSYYQLNIILFV